MKVVIDSSAAFKWVVAEKDSDKAIQLREEYRNGIHELVSPDIFAAEIANALLVAERRGRINPGEFSLLLADMLTTTPHLEATIPLLPLVEPIVNSFRVSIYDALYVALAQQEQCEMVTDDMKLINSLKKHYPFIRSVSSLP
jgi:predicted nucleic acid-binding protein